MCSWNVSHWNLPLICNSSPSHCYRWSSPGCLSDTSRNRAFAVNKFVSFLVQCF
jgi:hypothetical protein